MSKQGYLPDESGSASAKIHELETTVDKLNKKLRAAQDMNLELFQMYKKASDRLHALEDSLIK